MTEQTTKMNVKFGAIQIDYEGDIAELNEQLPEILATLSKYTSVASAVSSQATSTTTNLGSQQTRVSNDDIELSTSTIATRMSAKSCGDLACAASVNLHFVQKKSKFSYKEILDEMHEASSFYKKSMKGSNLKNALNKLVKDKKLNECGGNVYALHSSAIPEFEAQLAAS